MKKVLSVFLAIVLVLSIIPMSAFTVSAASTKLEVNKTQQTHIDTATTHWYTFTATENQYYRFLVQNQSAGLRTGIGIFDSFFNFFVSGLTVTVYDAYDLELSTLRLRIGYEGRIELKLKENSTYKIKVTATVAGNYNITPTQLADIGGNTWQEATEILPVSRITAATDANGDQDWYYFIADSERAYYNFELENVSGSGTLRLWLYEYVEGAGETPYRTITNFYVNSNREGTLSLQLNENSKYMLCLLRDSGTGGYQLDITQSLDAAGATLDEAYVIDRDVEYITSFDGLNTNDYDYYKFTTADYDAYYHVNMKNLTGVWSYVAVYDSRGDEVVYSGYGYGDKSINAKLEPNSTYYVLAKGENIGNYQLEVVTKKDVYKNQLDIATSVKRDTAYTSSFDGTNDRDYMKFTTANYDAYYHVNMTNTSGVWSFVNIYDANGDEVVCSGFGYGNKSINAKLEPNSTYYVLVGGDSVGNYNVEIVTKKDVFKNQREIATTIERDTLYKSSYDGTNDRDYMKFTTADYDAYYFVNKTNASSVWSFVNIYNANGDEVKCSGFGYGNKSINAKLEPNSTYYVLVGGDTVGNYELEIVTKKDTFPNEFNLATKIKLKTTYKTSFDGNGDADYVKFTTTKDIAEYHIQFKNLSSNWSNVILYDAAGNELSVAGSNYGDKYINKKLEPNTTYYLRIRADNVGNYELLIDYTVDDGGDSFNNATKMSLNKVHELKLSSDSDVDWFKFEVSREKKYRLRLIDESVSRNLYGYLYNSREAYITSIGSDTLYTLEAGTYYLKIDSDGSGYYTLAIAQCGDNHVEGYAYEPATTKEVGIRKTVCKYCGYDLGGRKEIAKIKTIKASATTFVYNGKVQRPTFTVKDTNGKTITSYDVVWSNSGSKDAGKYTAKIVFKGAYGGTKTFTYTITLKTPTAKISQTESGVKITWGKISGAGEYAIYRSYYSGGKWSSWKAVKTVTGTSYIDASAPSGYKVKYTIRAVKGDYKSAFKDSNTIYYLAAPKTSYTNTADGVKVTWKKVTGAKQYILYKSRYYNGAWTAWANLGTFTTTSYIDSSVKSNHTVKYTVRAVNGSYKSGFKDNAGLLYLATPKAKLSSAATGVKISWSKVSGAKSYIIYISTYSSGKWSAWKTVKTVTTTSYIDAAAKSGYNVKYAVRAVNGNYKSDYVESAKLYYLAAPTAKVSCIENGVKVSWAKVGGATQYIVYRSKYSGGKWSSWATVATVSELSFVDSTVKSNSRVKYTIRAIKSSYKSSYKDGTELTYLAAPTVTIANAKGGINVVWNKISGANEYVIYKSVLTGGKWSGWSNVATVTSTSYLDMSVASGETVKYTVRAVNGTNKSAYVSSTETMRLAEPKPTVTKQITGGVTVTWEEVDGAVEYLVFRRRLNDDAWTEWINIGTVSNTEFFDPTVQTNGVYQYAVYAVNGNYISSFIESNSVIA